VLSDLEMPGTDGLEFLSTIRAEHPGLPFILFTGNESEQTVTEAFDRGATDFVPKSVCAISEELLCRRIEQARCRPPSSRGDNTPSRAVLGSTLRRELPKTIPRHI